MEGKGGEGGMGREERGEGDRQIKLEYHSNQIGGGALAP